MDLIFFSNIAALAHASPAHAAPDCIKVFLLLRMTQLGETTDSLHHSSSDRQIQQFLSFIQEKIKIDSNASSICFLAQSSGVKQIEGYYSKYIRNALRRNHES